MRLTPMYETTSSGTVCSETLSCSESLPCSDLDGSIALVTMLEGAAVLATILEAAKTLTQLNELVPTPAITVPGLYPSPNTYPSASGTYPSLGSTTPATGLGLSSVSDGTLALSPMSEA